MHIDNRSYGETDAYLRPPSAHNDVVVNVIDVVIVAVFFLVIVTVLLNIIGVCFFRLSMLLPIMLPLTVTLLPITVLPVFSVASLRNSSPVAIR